MSRTHGGKGDRQRRAQISALEVDLRWELIKAKPKRKKEILKQLEEIRNERNTPKD